MSLCIDPQNGRALQNDLLTPDEVAAILGVTIWALNDWRRGGQPRNGLPFYKIKGRVRYRRQEVIQFALARRTQALAPIGRAA